MIHGHRPGFDAAIEYSRLMDDCERIYTFSERISRELADIAPTEHDLGTHLVKTMCRAAPIEYMNRAEKGDQYLCIETGNTIHNYTRSKCYAVVRINGVEWHARNFDKIRQRFYEAATLMAGHIATAAIEKGHAQTTVRAAAGMFPRYIRHEDVPMEAVADHCYDDILVRLAAYYFVAPPGPEPRPEERR